MPSTMNLFTTSCLVASLFTSLTSAAAIPALVKRQGCASVEPNDPNCMLPFWTDLPLNLTFDDLTTAKPAPTYWHLDFTNFTVQTPNTKAVHYITPQSGSNYLRLRANQAGFIAPDADMSFARLLGFYFACTHTSYFARQGRPQNCTVNVNAMCAGPGSSVIDVQSMPYSFDYTTPSTTAVGKMTYADMKTNGQEYECYNYTLTAEGSDGAPAVLFLDQMDIVTYFDSGL